jgi:hypothetical protein
MLAIHSNSQSRILVQDVNVIYSTSVNRYTVLNIFFAFPERATDV